MKESWGGQGLDTINEEELKEVGYEKCKEYCSRYCWPYGYGYCDNCAFDKERTNRRKAGAK